MNADENEDPGFVEIEDVPDPRKWLIEVPGLKDLIADIEDADTVAALLSAQQQDSSMGPALPVAVDLLRQSRSQMRTLLAEMILGIYGIPVPEEEVSPFGHAGASRAFGTGSSRDKTQG